MNFNSQKKIEQELLAIEKGEHRAWGMTSLLLFAIDKTGFWQDNCDSFTNWLEKNASLFKVKPATLWRILTAGRFSNQVREQLANNNILVPHLEDMPCNISPENIEILAKLKRVVPKDIFLYFARRVFKGKAKRSELRSSWQTYRPILKGQTARGRGVPTPQLDNSNPAEHDSLLEAVALDALKSVGPNWSGHQYTTLYQMFLSVNPDDYPQPDTPYEHIRSVEKHLFAAIAVVKPKYSEIEYHGFHYLKRDSECLEVDMEQYCDFVWFIISAESLTNEHISWLQHKSPSCTGLLEIKDGEVKILKRAERCKEDVALKEKLVSSLLKRSLQGK